MTRSAEVFRFGEFLLDARRRGLSKGQAPIHLKPKEWDLLYYLIVHRERLVEKDELIDALWPRQLVTEANLTQTVYRVRRALGESARQPRFIQTASRLGYQFIGEIDDDPPTSTPDAPRSVAMVPFLGNDADTGPSDWSLGLTETVIRALSADRDLDVRPLSAVMHPGAGRGKTGRASLNVDAVIEGTISERQDSIRVVTNIEDGRSGKLLWSKVWTVDNDEGALAQLRIAEAIHERLATSKPAERSRPLMPEVDHPEARTAYLRGRYCWHQFTEASLKRSIDLFDEAFMGSPGSAAPLAWRAAAWAALGNIGVLTPHDSAERARRDADRAIAMDDRLAAGFEMRGVIELYFEWNLEAALRSLDLAIERDPESANAHHLRGNALAFSGNFGAALLSLQRAELIDPTSLITLTDLGLVHYLGGHLEKARTRLEAVLAQNDYFDHARLKLAFVLAAMGKADEALLVADRIQRASQPGALPELAFFQGLAGSKERAAETIAASTGDTTQLTDPYSLALAYLGIDDHNGAIEALNRALEFRSRQLVLLAVDPVWTPLRQDPAFTALTTRIGLA
jgi:DNA-binding winged helix-turn-helix (wHTH) protein/tetratricopeptide (TPR) repeat protein